MPVPHRTDESDTNTLPDPELNPMLNPLLAAHMGRWAEVYFTAPPEKRAQAVSKLLRELRNGAPHEPASVPVINPAVNPVINDEKKSEKKAEAGAEGEEAPDSAASEESLRICGVCAHKNSAGQRFCGMCGAPLQVSPEAQLPQAAEVPPISAMGWSEPEPSPGGGDFSES